MANQLSSESLFYACIIPFIIFFGAFATVIYPMRDILHPVGAFFSVVTETHTFFSTGNLQCFSGAEIDSTPETT